MSLLYIVEDDAAIRELEAYALENGGFRVQSFADGEALFAAMAKQMPDLLLLDVMLPGIDGLSILKTVRADLRTRELPVLMVTAKTTELDRVKGLDMGADDYIAKPFGIMELIARVRALLRRTKPETHEMVYKELIFDEESHKVSVMGNPVELTFKEFELLKHLLLNRGTVMSREKLMNAVWGFAFAGASRTVDMHIKTLRHKLGEYGKEIVTIRNVGYRLGD
ncbi:MAG: response regulator transcription factor [Clostridiales bacterium]|nr:response regulator transcription factor [Clostridiales bacterium]